MNKKRMINKTYSSGFECIALSDFIDRFKKRTSECILKIYHTPRPIVALNESNQLMTTLPSEIFTIVTFDFNIVSEYQSANPKFSISSHSGFHLPIHLAHFVLHTLGKVHKRCRNNFYDTLEHSCAAANDFITMMNLLNKWWDDFVSRYRLMTQVKNQSYLSLQGKRQELLTMYLQDAVYSAQIVHSFVMEPIQTELAMKIYSNEWEETSQPNSVITSIIKTMQDYLLDIRVFLESSFLFHKFFDALMSALVTFLVQRLIMKAKYAKKSNVLSSTSRSRFNNPQRAAQQFADDITAIQSYFDTFSESIPGSATSIQRHFNPLECICLFLHIVKNWQPQHAFPAHDIRTVAHALHRISGKVTGKFMRDLTFLFSHVKRKKISSKRARRVYEFVCKNLDTIHDLEMVEHYRYYSFIDDQVHVIPPVFRLDQFLISFYDRRESSSRRCAI